jgi:hypothetical protein
MASASTHLLSLPREIRDQIYGYIHRPLFFAIPSSLVAATGYARVEVPMAPISNVLLTCTRMKDEYLESCVYADHTVVLHKDKSSVYRTSRATEVTDATIRSTRARDWSSLKAAFKQFKHMVLLMEGKCSFEGLNNLRNLDSMLKNLCPLLSSVKVGISTKIGRPSSKFDAPGSFLGLPIYQICMASRRALKKVDNTPKRLGCTYVREELRLMLYTKVGALRYGSLWTPGQASQVHPARRYPVETEQIIAQLDSKKKMWLEGQCGYDAEIKDWQEMAGDELTNYLAEERRALMEMLFGVG